MLKQRRVAVGRSRHVLLMDDVQRMDLPIHAANAPNHMVTDGAGFVLDEPPRHDWLTNCSHIAFHRVVGEFFSENDDEHKKNLPIV